jgi:hypothetical protein
MKYKIEFTKAEINQLKGYAEERDRGEDYGWYYGNKEQFEKRHKEILRKFEAVIKDLC